MHQAGERAERVESELIEEVGERARIGGRVEGMDFEVVLKGKPDDEFKTRVPLEGKVKGVQHPRHTR